MSTFGWAFMSRDALRRAESQLSGDAAGVRDEIGFLLIHQRYADRFFPGTSVLHTRLRYVLFVPWMYKSLLHGPVPKSVNRAVEQAEIRLAGRLSGMGVIGGQKYPDATSQPPSIVYWTALGAWGLLRPLVNGGLPSRARVHAMLQKRPRSAIDDDGVPMYPADDPFVVVPLTPAGWDGDCQLDFCLSPKEIAFLRARLIAVNSPADPTKLSLLARLFALDYVPDVSRCWEHKVLEVAQQDRAPLERAGQAAALSAIGRGVYAALVEQLRDDVDGRPTTRLHRDYLPEVVEEHVRAASQLDILALLEDLGGLPELTVAVLESTLEWLRHGGGDPSPLRECYANAEHERKHQRARLTLDLSGRERRFEWNNETHTLAEPLHFRWSHVRRLLSDLQGQP